MKSMKYHLKGTVIHDERRLSFNSPLEFRNILELYPLDLEYIDWWKKQRYALIFDRDKPNEYGRTFLVMHDSNGFIIVGFKDGMNKQLDITLAHELIHTAVPDARLSVNLPAEGREQLKEYEKVIDEIAREYAKDKQFMDYIKKFARFEQEF